MLKNCSNCKMYNNGCDRIKQLNITRLKALKTEKSKMYCDSYNNFQHWKQK